MNDAPTVYIVQQLDLNVTTVETCWLAPLRSILLQAASRLGLRWPG
jgi:hypothetical protein